MKVFHPAALKPAEDLFVRVFGLIARRIPVKCVEHARFRIGLSIYRKYVVHSARYGVSDQRNASEPTVEVIKRGNCDLQNTMQHRGRHSARVTAVEISEAIPLVVAAIEPYGETSPGLQKLWQDFYGGFAIRRMVQHAETVDAIKLSSSKGRWKTSA